MVEVAIAIVYRNTAYLPVKAKIKGDGHFAIDPVFTASLNAPELVSAFERVISAGHPIISEPSWLEMRLRKDPILAATGAKSWNQLAKNGASYTIDWYGDQITVYMSRLDKKGRFVEDPDKTRVFPENTSLSTLVEVILADVKTRPELGT